MNMILLSFDSDFNLIILPFFSLGRASSVFARRSETEKRNGMKKIFLQVSHEICLNVKDFINFCHPEYRPRDKTFNKCLLEGYKIQWKYVS